MLAGPNLTASDGTTAKHAVGDTYVSKGGAVYMYCKATAATIAAYSACSGANPAAMEEGTTTTVGNIGTGGGFACVPQFAVAASEYFWGWVGPGYLREDGVTKFKVLAANAAGGAQLFSTATDGVLDDASSGGEHELNGCILSETVTTQEAADVVAYSRIHWKQVQDRD